MKELGIGVLKLIGALLVFPIMIILGFLYAIGHAIYMSLVDKNLALFFKLMWRLIDGNLAALGHVLGAIAYGLDLSSNVNGEIYEDVLTAEEDTLYGKKNISVSSATGDIELRGKVLKGREWFSKMLNWAFRQKQHAIDSIKYDRGIAKLKEVLFK